MVHEPTGGDLLRRRGCAGNQRERRGINRHGVFVREGQLELCLENPCLSDNVIVRGLDLTFSQS